MEDSTKPINLRSKALDFLSRRDYSYQELFNKLLRYSENTDEITVILDELVAKKFLNEERYIETFINSKSKKFGSLKIKYLLNSKTNNSELVNQVYENAEINELKIAIQQLQKKYPTPPTDHKERAKYIRFLLNRGFNMDIIIQALKAL